MCKGQRGGKGGGGVVLTYKCSSGNFVDQKKFCLNTSLGPGVIKRIRSRYFTPYHLVCRKSQCGQSVINMGVPHPHISVHPLYSSTSTHCMLEGLMRVACRKYWNFLASIVGEKSFIYFIYLHFIWFVFSKKDQHLQLFSVKLINSIRERTQ